MSTKRTDAEKKALVTQDELDKAVLEARQQGETTARIEVGEWIEANMLGGPYYTVYSNIFPPIIKRLKEGKRLKLCSLCSRNKEGNGKEGSADMRFTLCR